MPSIHSIHRHQAYLAYDNSIKPTITIESGDTVTFDCIDASNGMITAESTAADVQKIIFEKLDPVHGPVFINGAKPGDVLQIDVVKLECAPWGWTGLIPGFGLLADEMKEADIRIWKLDNENMCTYFDYTGKDGKPRKIKIPLKPFAGEMGMALAKPGAHSTIPPYRTGGNMDVKHMGVGSRVFLPIEVEGGLFSVGDGHAVQGDGEVCGTAIETPMKVTVKLTVRKDRGSYTDSPHFLSAAGEPDDGAYYSTTGVKPDLLEAAKDATRSMIEFLHQTHGMTKNEAYILCSVAGDLRILEAVDMPNYMVGMMIPRKMLEDVIL